MLVNVFSQISYIGDYVWIISAMCNAYRQPRVQVTSSNDEIIAQRMLVLSKKNPTISKRF